MRGMENFKMFHRKFNDSNVAEFWQQENLSVGAV
jgi:hypothetical protein